jgi:hypothetical protein
LSGLCAYSITDMPALTPLTPVRRVCGMSHICDRGVMCGRRARHSVGTRESALNLPRPMLALMRASDPKLASPVGPPAMLVVDPPEHTR